MSSRASHMLTFTMNARFAVNVVWEWFLAVEDSGIQCGDRALSAGRAEVMPA